MCSNAQVQAFPVLLYHTCSKYKQSPPLLLAVQQRALNVYPPYLVKAKGCTFREFRTTQVAWVHRDVRPTSRVEADLIAFDDNARGLGFHSIAHSFKLRRVAKNTARINTLRSYDIPKNPF